MNYSNDFLNLDGSLLFQRRNLTIDGCFTLLSNLRLRFVLNFELQSFLLCFYSATTAIMLEPI